MRLFPATPSSRRITRSDLYPFRDLKPGHAADVEYPMTDLHRLRSSVSYYRKKLGMDLRISIVEDDKGKPPYLIVGVPGVASVADLL